MQRLSSRIRKHSLSQSLQRHTNTDLDAIRNLQLFLRHIPTSASKALINTVSIIHIGRMFQQVFRTAQRLLPATNGSCGAVRLKRCTGTALEQQLYYPVALVLIQYL
jgi:hypothetical protein